MVGVLLLRLLGIVWLLRFMPSQSSCRPKYKSGPGGWGVQIHTYTEPEAEFAQLSSAFKLARKGVGWYLAEPRPNEFDFSRWDKLLAAHHRNCTTPLWIFWGGNTAYSNASDNFSFPISGNVFAAFARFVTVFVSHFQGHGIVWELFNEANREFTPSQYAELAIMTGEALSSAGLLATEHFIGPGLAGPCAAGDPANLCMNHTATYGWLDETLAHGLLRYFDGVSVHPYRSNAPETLLDDYAKLAELVDRHKSDSNACPVALLNTELGYSTCSPPSPNCTDAGALGNLSAMDQASYLARVSLVDNLAGVNVSIWYEWVMGFEFPPADPYIECYPRGGSDRPDPTQAEENFGVVQCGRDSHGARPQRPAFQAAATLQRVFKGCFFHRRVRPTCASRDMTVVISNSVFMLEFVCNEENDLAVTAVAAWATYSTPVDVTLTVGEPSSSSPVWMYEMVGEGKDGRLIPRKSDGTVNVVLSRAPLYLRSAALLADVLRTAGANAIYS